MLFSFKMFAPANVHVFAQSVARNLRAKVPFRFPVST